MYLEYIIWFRLNVSGRSSSDDKGTPQALIPYHASIEVFITKQTVLFICTGAIISSNFVLTTAHCVFEIDPDELRVRVGTLEREENGILYKVRETMFHENYTWTLVDDNIGLVRIRRTFDGGVARAIPIFRALPGGFVANDTALLTGWGAVNHETRIKLWAVDVRTYRNDTCLSAYVVSPTEILCHGSYTHSRWFQRCFGDVGGLVAANGVLIGLTYYTSCEMNLMTDSVYVEVSHFYDWIAERVPNLL